MKTTILFDHDGPATGARTVRALLRIEGDAPAGADRTPLNLSLVLDRSGSMAGENLHAAKEAARLVVRRLWPEDVVSVVAYDDEVRVVAPPSRGQDAPDLDRRIASIQAGGSTNLSGGWLKGRELVAGRRPGEGRTGGVNRVILLTDGLANVGITEPATLAGLCQTAAAEGVTTTTVGFGMGFDERLLRAMADAGRGSTYYIEHADQAGSIFDEELQGLLSLTAQNLSVEIVPAADARLVAVHHSFPRRETATGSLLLELGDLYAREPRAVLVEMETSGPAGADVLELGTMIVRGDVLTSGGGVERRRVTCRLTLNAQEGPRVDPEVRRELLLAATAKAREEALEREYRLDFGGAAEALRAVATKIREQGFSGDERLGDEAADLDAMAERTEVGALDAADRKYLYQRSYESSRNRKEAYRRISREQRKGRQ